MNFRSKSMMLKESTYGNETSYGRKEEERGGDKN